MSRAMTTLNGRWSGIRHDYDEGVVHVVLHSEDHELRLVQVFETPSIRR